MIVRRLLPIICILAEMALLPTLGIGCKSRVVERSSSFMWVDMDFGQGRVVECDAYFTWEDHDRGKEDGVMYIWNGEKVGRGSEGFAIALARLRTLLRNSTVLIYPVYFSPKSSCGPLLNIRQPPFSVYPEDGLEAFYQIIIERNITYVFSFSGPTGAWIRGSWYPATRGK